jgi:hypothetical protein
VLVSLSKSWSLGACIGRFSSFSTGRGSVRVDSIQSGIFTFAWNLFSPAYLRYVHDRLGAENLCFAWTLFNPAYFYNARRLMLFGFGIRSG